MESGEDSSFADRMKALIGENSVSSFARKCGIGESLMRTYLIGSDPGRANVEKIWKASGCRIEWLMTGEGPMYGTAPDKAARAVRPVGEGREILESSDGREYLLLPRYDIRVSAGAGSVVHSEQIVDYYAFNRRWFEDRVAIPPAQAVLLEVQGDSMEPDLHDGEMVIVDTSRTTFVAEAIYVLLIDGELRIKRVNRRLDGTVEIRSSNERYGVEVLRPEQAERLIIVGRARRVINERRLP